MNEEPRNPLLPTPDVLSLTSFVELQCVSKNFDEDTENYIVVLQGEGGDQVSLPMAGDIAALFTVEQVYGGRLLLEVPA